MTVATVPAFAGHAYRLEVDNGTVFRNSYAADGSTLTWLTEAGAKPGSTETVDLSVAEVAPRIYFVSWTEASTGITVSHVMDLNAGHVYAYWTWDDGGPKRAGELHEGKLTLIS